jgi:tellurite resistance protein TerC
VLDVPLWVWFATIGAIALLLALDFLVVDRHPHAVKLKEAAWYSVFYVGIAILFGIGLLVLEGGSVGGQYFAGWLVEKSLSVDNLFVFVIIMTSFAVPAEYQHRVLLFGITVALILRGIFIAIGAAAIQRFSFTFVVFGVFLIFTAWKLAKHRNDEPELSENPVLRFVRRVLPTTSEYHGTALTTRIDGRRFVTPMLVVLVAIGTTDVLFALDSIPAVFGVTQDPYLVFTANAFALLGLRALYFLVHGLLDRLVYLSIGLAVILGFIGVKLILEFAHEVYGVVPEIPVSVSLVFILVVLTITTVASLLKVRYDTSAVRAKGVEPQPAGELQRVPDDGDGSGSERVAPEPVSETEPRG